MLQAREPAGEDARRTLARHPLISQRKLLSLPSPINLSLYAKAEGWIAPWSMSGYPGKVRLMAAVLGFRVCYQATYWWKRRPNGVPKWAAELLASHIEARCAAGMALVAELREHIETESKRVHHLSNLAGNRPDGSRRRGMGARARQLPVVEEKPTEP